MPTIERRPLENAADDRDRWARIAALITAWAQSGGVALRDAIVLLPFAQLLPHARQAFARAGGWLPRIETTRTLAASLGPAPRVPAGQLSFDTTLDALSAAALLRSQTWGSAWARRDARGFEQAALAVMTTAHELARVAFTLAPAQRAEHWANARAALPPLAGPGASERLLARVALEWACLAAPPPTDRLFALAPPSAWIAVQAGGPDDLSMRVMLAATVPCLLLDTDAAETDPFAAVPADHPPAFTICDSFEHEAQCAAAQVFAHVQRGEVPVALIAQDRVLVRRVRALLERERLRLVDETGWKLSTTRAAARVMSLLEAARHGASTDALLDWLKAGAMGGHGDDAALASLEATCRRDGIGRIAALARARLEPQARRLCDAALAVLGTLTAVKRQPLPAWLAALASALERSGALRLLTHDDAGRQVLAALRLGSRGPSAGDWLGTVDPLTIGLDEFRTWIDSVLEQATYLPGHDGDVPPQVVITPMARAILRPFAAIVFPGADDQHLGAPPAPVGLIGDAQRAALGMPTAAQRRAAELFAFVHLLAAPQISFMRRRADGADPLADSPLVARLSLALARHGRAFAAWHDPRIDRELLPTPIRMSAPSAAGLLPQRLSASGCEALRACPYRFFALNLLRLREDDELDREIEKRDYGSWLHGVLFEFHRGRTAPGAAADEVERLLALARISQAAQGLADADFLPFIASFASFAPRYIAWLHDRDADGTRWLRGEDELIAEPAALEGTALRGIVDRIDEWRGGTLQLIDYKTGSVASLKDRVRQPLEDTQLAFYAALVGATASSEVSLRATYLALDGTKAIDEVEHPDVRTSAAALVEGLAHDLRRLRAGAGLPALGEGATCDYCAARGICRRDHWSGS